MSPEAREILLIGRALVDYGWIKEDMAHDEQGAYVSATSLEACAWCSIGAIDRALYFLDGERSFDNAHYKRLTHGRKEAVQALARVVDDSYKSDRDEEMQIVAFNDARKTTHAMVVAAFDTALRED
jgi:hypothetical protein